MSNGYTTIDQIKAANKKLGHHWFSIDSVDHHGTRIETGVIGNYYFVESGYTFAGEPASGRVFRAVAAGPDGDVRYLRGGDTFATLDEALAAITSTAGG
ncbi:MAG: hypothetical protein WAX14_08340 [Rhodococcus sp. (in: high G+C Gram-positive bacteria)]|uniref:DUF7447 family protein n=1 Tax=Rhodococcus sp. TaxID=1831 RepID=UPI003BB7B7D8